MGLRNPNKQTKMRASSRGHSFHVSVQAGLLQPSSIKQHPHRVGVPFPPTLRYHGGTAFFKSMALLKANFGTTPQKTTPKRPKIGGRIFCWSNNTLSGTHRFPMKLLEGEGTMEEGITQQVDYFLH